MSTMNGYLAGLGTVVVALGVGFVGGVSLTETTALKQPASGLSQYAKAEVQHVSRPAGPPAPTPSVVQVDTPHGISTATTPPPAHSDAREPVPSDPAEAPPAAHQEMPSSNASLTTSGSSDIRTEANSAANSDTATKLATERRKAERRRNVMAQKKKQAVARAQTRKQRDLDENVLEVRYQSAPRSAGMFGAGPSFFGN